MLELSYGHAPIDLSATVFNISLVFLQPRPSTLNGGIISSDGKNIMFVAPINVSIVTDQKVSTAFADIEQILTVAPPRGNV